MEGQLETLNQQLNASKERENEATSNILNNTNFIEQFENTLLYLLAGKEKINNVTFNREEKIPELYRVIKGTWQTSRSNTYVKDVGVSERFTFNEQNAISSQHNLKGEVKDLIFDKGYNVLSFKIDWENNTSINFHLIYITRSELRGFYNSDFISFKRIE